jgi:ferredoxin/flavodoxin---NADP+ reductase
VTTSANTATTNPKEPIAGTIEKIIWKKQWAEKLFSFRLTRPTGFHFVPGQFARIGLIGANGEILWRPYSIASATSDNFLEFFSVVVDGGQFTTKLGACAVGDGVHLDPVAQGFLTAERFFGPSEFERNARDLWLFATGTGLAPFISMAQEDNIWAQFDRLVIVQTTREAADLAYHTEIAAINQSLATRYSTGAKKSIVHVRTVTRQPDDATHLGDAKILHGRATALLESGELMQSAGVALDDKHSRFMLCGNPAMVQEIRQILKARGFRMNRKLEAGHIVVENYW